MRNFFLYKVWLHNKKLFYVITVFAGLTVCFNLSGDEVTPFFVWGMYSAKEQPVKEYEILQITINDNHVINLYDYHTPDTRFYLLAPLIYYKQIKENNYHDPTVLFLQARLHQHYAPIRFLEKKAFNTGLQKEAFLNWYTRYLEQVTDINIRSVRIDVIKAHYKNQNLVADSVYLFEKWEKP